MQPRTAGSFVIEENPCGGKGTMKIEHLLGEQEMKDKCKMYARVTLPPGAVLGYHEHHGNGECYFVLSGEGVYDDNGVKRTLKAGDVTISVVTVGFTKN